jgi:DNA modification methylase
MAVIESEVNDKYAIYNGDCIEVASQLKSDLIHLSVYSPPFSDLYSYSSSERDLSNCKSYEEFMEHYGFLVKEISRITIPGRLTAVHCTDIAQGGGNGMRDFPGDIIRLHEKNGFVFHARYTVWKEPLRVAIRTRALGLMHKQIVKDSSLCGVASADYIIVMRKRGENKIPIAHPQGLSYYAGERVPPDGLAERFKNHKDPKTNKYSHWIWQQYASCMWDDVRINNVLPYKHARETDEEKHVCPLQLDVIERCLILWSNLGEILFTPFMGVGSEVYSAIKLGRRAVGTELKPTYYRQAKENIQAAIDNIQQKELDFEATQ